LDGVRSQKHMEMSWVGAYPDVMVRTVVADSASGIEGIGETAPGIIEHSAVA